MERPSRNKKSVSYSDFLEDDDEDFATAKAPPNKKARASVSECQPDKNRRDEIGDSTAKGRKERVSLEEKMYERDLDTALLLSRLQSGGESEEPLSSNLDGKSETREDAPPVLTHFSVEGGRVDDEKPSSRPSEDAPPVLSNCSVDVTCLGLDQITSEQTASSAACTKRRSRTFQDAKENEDEDGDDDYRPQNTPESESEFSDQDESEDEEFTVKRKGGKKKTAKSEKKPPPKAVKKEKKPAKTKAQSKVKNAAVSSPGVRSPSAAKPLSALNRTPTTPPVTKSALQTSPAGGRMPKWTPPGQVGRSPNSCQSPPVKSPGLGLRLGLSRLARVKPLHPNAVAH